MFEAGPELSGARHSVRVMKHLTADERAEWIENAIDALRGRILIRSCDAQQAYTELAGERAWRSEELAGGVLREAYETVRRA